MIKHNTIAFKKNIKAYDAELSRWINRYLVSNIGFSIVDSTGYFYATLSLANQVKKTSFSKIRLSCNFTGRNRAVLLKFKLARMCFKTYAAFGFFPGICKANW